MRTKLIFSVIVLLLFLSCSTDKNPLFSSYTLELSFEFPTESNPNSIAIDKDHGVIYVSNCRSSLSNDSKNIQKFNLKGELLSTIVDYTNINYGSYPYYEPIDLAIDNAHNICVLVKPFLKNERDEYWSAFKGFCIITHNHNGEFLKEYDFAQYNLEFSPVALSLKDDFFYVTNSYSLLKIHKSTGQLINLPLPTKKEDTYSRPEFFTSDLVVDNENNIWVVGQTAFDNTSVGCHVTKMDPTCTNRFTFNSYSKTYDYGAMLNNPGIALDKNGNIYLATFYGKSLEVYNSSGLLLGNFEFQKGDRKNPLPMSVALDKLNNIYVLDRNNDLVHVIKNQ